MGVVCFSLAAARIHNPFPVAEQGEVIFIIVFVKSHSVLEHSLLSVAL